jgi:hypothetical protein
LDVNFGSIEKYKNVKDWKVGRRRIMRKERSRRINLIFNEYLSKNSDVH